MTVTALLAPIPKWVMINNQGTVAGGAFLYTYRSLNKIQPKIVYQDPGMTIPYTNPIIFDLNGTQGPFYWTVDSANLADTYYLVATDAQGNELWTIDNYFPSGSGGGGNVTTFLPLTNYIANNQFIDHIDATANPTNTTNLVIAPGNHKGFTPALVNPIIGTYGALGSDTRFVKNNTVATDQITFPLFPLASAPLVGDVTPVDYIRYQCTNNPAGETYKAFQFPICQKVKNLANQSMTMTIWAAVTATPVTLPVYIRQYFGSGTSASAEVLTAVGSITLTTTWTLYNIPLTIPSVAGKSIGTLGSQTDDDGLYIQLGMPLGTACDVLFTKPALYLGTIDPTTDFEDYDQINSITQSPRVGSVMTSFQTAAPPGWIPMNDGSIGNVGSAATTRANADTFFLYKTLWDGVIDTWAPVSTGRGASAVADFIAGKTLTLPLSLGRAMAGAGTGAGLSARALGQNVGEESHLQTINEMPAHTHAYLTTHTGGAGASANGAATTTLDNTTSTGGGVAFNIMQPTSFMNIFIKL